MRFGFEEQGRQALDAHHGIAAGVGLDIVAQANLRIEEHRDVAAVERLELALLQPRPLGLALGAPPEFVHVAANPALHFPVGDPFAVKAGDVRLFDQRVVVDGIAVAVAILGQGGRRQQRGEQNGAHQWTCCTAGAALPSGPSTLATTSLPIMPEFM